MNLKIIKINFQKYQKNLSLTFSKANFFLTLIVFSFTAVLGFLNSSSVYVTATSRAEKIAQELKGINNGIEDISIRKYSLEDEVKRINQEIDRTENIIKESEEVIINLETDIKKNSEEINVLVVDTKKTLREMQVSGDSNPIKQILSAENLSEFLNQIYVFSSRHYKLKEYTDKLESTNQKMQANIKNQEQILTESKMTKNVLLATKDDKDSLIKEFSGREQEYTARIKTLKDQEQEIEKLAKESQEKWEREKSQQVANNQNRTVATKTPPNDTGRDGGQTVVDTPVVSNPINTTPVGCRFEDTRDLGIVGFINPVPGATVFRGNDFGCPTASGRIHDGIDLHINGNPSVKATASGVVANKGSFNVVGYGNWVLIRHSTSSGENIYSLYAHMLASSPLTVGANVSQGQTVGNVGCSGLCWGDHVHFMLYSNSYEKTGLGCNHGSSKCLNPARFISF